MIDFRTRHIAVALIALILSGGIASGATIVDFKFDEAAGTAMVDFPTNGPTTTVTDSASGYKWTASSTAEQQHLEGVTTDGLGVLRPTGFNTSSARDGRVALLAAHQINATQNSIARMFVTFEPWSFGTFESGNTEEIRFGFGNTSATNVLVGVHLLRGANDSVSLQGVVTTGTSGTQQTLFTNVQAEPVTVYLDIDKINNVYTVSTKIGAGLITPLAGNIGLTLDPARNGNHLRLTFDGNFSDDTFGISRYGVSVNIPEPSTIGFGMFAITVGVLGRRRSACL